MGITSFIWRYIVRNYKNKTATLRI